MRGELAFEYSRDQLLSLRLAAGQLPDIAIRRRIDHLLRPSSRRPYRGCRAGRRKDQAGVKPGLVAESTRLAGNGSSASSPVRRQQQHDNSRVYQHQPAATPTVKFASLNICSIEHKLDDLLEIRRDRSIDIICLVETWHDDDCVGFRRLRVDGYSVVDRPRRDDDDTLQTNHGGVCIIAAPGSKLVSLPITDCLPSTFEVVSARLEVSQYRGVVVVIYRPGSQAIQSAFFTELAAVFDVVATFREPVFITGDLNIRLDRPDDPHSVQLHDLVARYGFVISRTTPTHRRGGTLNVVISRPDSSFAAPTVTSRDVGLSDHTLLEWSVDTKRPIPVTEHYVTARPWRQLDIDNL